MYSIQFLTFAAKTAFFRSLSLSGTPSSMRNDQPNLATQSGFAINQSRSCSFQDSENPWRGISTIAGCSSCDRSNSSKYSANFGAENCTNSRCTIETCQISTFYNSSTSIDMRFLNQTLGATSLCSTNRLRKRLGRKCTSTRVARGADRNSFSRVRAQFPLPEFRALRSSLQAPQKQTSVGRAICHRISGRNKGQALLECVVFLSMTVALLGLFIHQYAQITQRWQHELKQPWFKKIM